MNDVLGSLNQPMSLLENLYIRIKPKPNQVRASLPVLFSGIAPRLRVLRLSGFNHWTSAHFGGHTHLFLAGWNTSSARAEMLEPLLDLLHDKPALQEVYLSNPDP